MAELTQESLQGRWVHSHEEDTGGEMVFRPASHPLPPSRGRLSFELRGDGTYVESAPGPVDVPEESGGDWALEGDRLVLGAKGDHAGRAWEVASVEDDRLIVKR